MVEHAEFPIEQVRPVSKNILEPVPIRNPEGEIDIGPPVTQTDRGRTDQSSSGNPWIDPDQFKDTIAHLVTIFGGKHADLPSASCRESYPTVLAGLAPVRRPWGVVWSGHRLRLGGHTGDDVIVTVFVGQ
jgi:hypothetical protein